MQVIEVNVAMPSKLSKDLSSDQFVAICKDSILDGPTLEITIRVEKRSSVTTELTGKESLDDLKRLGVLCGVESLSNRARINEIKIAVGVVDWMVLNADASEAGWGPFLYDIAMELATLAKAGLRSHDTKVSEDALRVWDFYFSNRSDVSKRKLPRKLKPKRREESLQFMYQKTPDTTLRELKKLGKWEESARIVDGDLG